MGIVTDNAKQINLSNVPRRVKVFDVDKKELLGTFESMTAAGKFSGISTDFVRTCIATKCRCYKNKLNKTLAFR